MVEEALLDKNEVNEVMSDRETCPGESDTETAADRSDIGAVLGEGECEAAADESEVQARSDVSSRNAIADGSDILEEKEEEFWLSISELVVERRGVLRCYVTLLGLVKSKKKEKSGE